MTVTAHVAQLQLKETLRKGIGSVAIAMAMALEDFAIVSSSPI